MGKVKLKLGGGERRVSRGAERCRVEGREVGCRESVPGGCGGDVLRGGEVRDFVTCWVAEQGECVGGCGQVGEEAEEVFCVQLGAVEGAGDVHAALDVGSEDGGID